MFKGDTCFSKVRHYKYKKKFSSNKFEVKIPWRHYWRTHHLHDTRSRDSWPYWETSSHTLHANFLLEVHCTLNIILLLTIAQWSLFASGSFGAHDVNPLVPVNDVTQFPPDSKLVRSFQYWVVEFGATASSSCWESMTIRWPMTLHSKRAIIWWTSMAKIK